MKVNKNIWTGKNKPYNRNSLYFPNGIDTNGTPPSGGGGSGESASTIEYLDVSGLGDTNQSLRNALVAVADIVKSKNEDGTFVGACLLGIQLLTGVTNNATTCVAVAVDLSRHIKGKSIEAGGALDMSIAEILIMMTSITQELLDSIPRITKEQFYTLE